MGGLRVGLGIVWLVGSGCTKSDTQREPASSPSAPVAAAAERSGAAKDEPAGDDPPTPAPAVAPELHLEVLREREATGLSVQNRGDAPQRFSAQLELQGPGEAIVLTQDASCLTLRPGAEWLWPADWGRTLAPEQSGLRSLEGSFQFRIRSCEGRATLSSPHFELPSRDY